MATSMTRHMVAALLIALTGVAHADSWMPPSTEVYVSPDQQWRLTVKPRDITSPLAYFEDKVAGKQSAGGVAGDAQPSAMATMEHRRAGRWRVAWSAPLVNEVSPVSAVASNTGQAVTFDNWHGMGHGPNAVAIYDTYGKLVRSLALTDLLPRNYVRALPRSVSSIHWRGEPHLAADGREIIVPVVIPVPSDTSLGGSDQPYIDIRIDLATGQAVEPASPQWAAALVAARLVTEDQEQQRKARELKFISPLKAPTGGDTREWGIYLMDAYVRLGSDSLDVPPGIWVVPLPGDARHVELADGFGDALAGRGRWASAPVLMVASPSQDALIDVLRNQATRVKPGSLSVRQLYVAVDGAHVQDARAALSATGVQLVQVDIDKPISQSRERLDDHAKRAAAETEGD